MSGAEGSSSWGLYVPGVGLREQELKGVCNESLTSEDALLLRGPADVKVRVINWVVLQELWGTCGISGTLLPHSLVLVSCG